MIKVNSNGVRYFDAGDGTYICTYYFGDGYEKTITLVNPNQQTLDRLSIIDFMD
jgi:hypothetical protein